MNATDGVERTLLALVLVFVLAPASGCASLHSYQVDGLRDDLRRQWRGARGAERGFVVKVWALSLPLLCVH